jgi:hypothetical protein
MFPCQLHEICKLNFHLLQFTCVTHAADCVSGAQSVKTTGVSVECWPAILGEIRGVWGTAAHQFADMPQSAYRHASMSVTTVNFQFVLGIHRSAATYRAGYHVSSQQDVKKQ